MRLFVAAVPPQHVVDHLDEFLDVRREHAAFRWTLPEQWHVTLAFSAEAPERIIDDVEERLSRAAARRHAFDLVVAGGGAFPHPADAKVLYARVQEVAAPQVPEQSEFPTQPAPPDHLGQLAVGARAALAKAGAAVDGQKFRPHLTLARLGHPEEVSNWVRLLDAYASPVWEVDEIELIASHLGEGPRRTPRYESLATFTLRD